jgi:hypothetical protein
MPMAGPKTTAYLAARDYETFYKLAHHLSEEALIDLIGIHSKAHIIDRLYQMSLPETCDDPVAARAADNSALQLKQSAGKAIEETRRFFWPDEAGGAVVRQINQGRWSPYDVRAWDAFFADLSEFTKARLRIIAPLIEQLQAVEGLSMVYVDPGGTERAWQIGQYIPRESYRRLTVLLTEDGFEATLRAP